MSCERKVRRGQPSRDYRARRPVIEAALAAGALAVAAISPVHAAPLRLDAAMLDQVTAGAAGGAGVASAAALATGDPTRAFTRTDVHIAATGRGTKATSSSSGAAGGTTSAGAAGVAAATSTSPTSSASGVGTAAAGAPNGGTAQIGVSVKTRSTPRVDIVTVRSNAVAFGDGAAAETSAGGSVGSGSTVIVVSATVNKTAGNLAFSRSRYKAVSIR